VTAQTDFDVVIVGYGPVGQFLAYKLGRLGYTSACIERFDAAYAFPRAVHFDDEIARLFQSIGLDPGTNPAVQQYDNLYRWVNADKEVLLEVDWRGIGKSGWNTSNFFYQPDLEREISAIVSSEENAQVFRGWEAIDLEQDAHGATITARRVGTGDSAETRTFRGRYVVGADGANSFTRNALGLTMTDLGFEFDWLIVDMFPNEPMDFDPPAWQWCRPAGPTTVVPGGAPHRRRWEWLRMPGESIEELNTPETAWKRLEEFGLNPENAVMERHVMYTFRARWADAWNKGRVFIAGDAAHLMPPFAGQGMCAGIRDAENRLWKLDAVMSGKADDSLLETYGPERTEHVRFWIDFSIGLGNVICVTDPEAAAARDAAMKSVVADPTLAPPPPAPAHLGDGIKGSHPEAGYLSYQGVVTVDGRTGRFDDVLGYGWTVVARPGALDGLTAATRVWADDYGVRLIEVGDGAAVSDDDRTYTAWFDSIDADAVIVRPDFYVYDAGAADGLDGALNTLREQLGSRVAVG
jgi:2-polyprenyl-6-methoxyphenol hydroxylase-like FAD-dependent oxidoreductase